MLAPELMHLSILLLTHLLLLLPKPLFLHIKYQEFDKFEGFKFRILLPKEILNGRQALPEALFAMI